MAEEPTLAISVVDPIDPAFKRAKLLCFSPFDLEKWFVIGFCAWLATLGNSGFNLPYDSYGKPSGFVESWRNHFPVELMLVVLFVSIAAAIGFLIMVVLVWLTSRGRFMFLHCVATNHAQVKVPWRLYGRQANSLFVFRIVAAIIFFVCQLPLWVIAGFCIHLLSRNSTFINIPIVSAVVILFVLIAAVFVVFLLTMKFTNDFVVPVMYLRRLSCVDAWREYLPLLRNNKARFIVYILFQFVISLVISAILFTLALATCCCAACLFSIPYIGTVILLPIFVFKRSYSLMYLRQYGSEFDVFADLPLFEA
ncbi:MAG: hypothetical protein PVG93_01270 [Phycisphaerales bacterium]